MKLKAIILIFLLSLPLAAQGPFLSPATIGTLEKAITSFMSRNDVPGLSIAVVENDMVAWENGYGLADLENFVPVKTSTVFRLASVSKPVTATAIMELYQQGKLYLDAPIQKYCPAFPQKPWPITTRELLGHLGGIRWYQGDEWLSTRHYDSMTDSLKIFANDPLMGRPGTKFVYTTYGYTVLGCVLEGASGQKYVDYVRQNIFVPAGMDHTEVDDVHKLINNRAQGYQKSKTGEIINSDLSDTSYKIPGGGWVSTAGDMARFAIALENGKLLKPQTRELMWTSQKTADGKETGYGLGWGISTDTGFRIVGHEGGQQRVATAIALAPDKKMAVVVLCNMEGADPLDFAEQLLKTLADSK
jgi:serine beta-lactamase-like protein LACTB, mitochondrial